MSDIVTLDINAILRQLPHRYPFLLVDRVTECRKGESIVALKNVTYNEPYFPGHFPHRPVMPGVIIIEALAQTAGILAFVTADVIPDENTRFSLWVSTRRAFVVRSSPVISLFSRRVCNDRCAASGSSKPPRGSASMRRPRPN